MFRVIYHLQQPGLYASTPHFLYTLAEGISREMIARDIHVKKLDYETLRKTYNPDTFDRAMLKSMVDLNTG